MKKDFDLNSTILNHNGLILLHDTDYTYFETLLVSEDAKKDFFPFDGPSKLVKELKDDPNWTVLNLFNHGQLRSKPSSTGLTVIQKNG